MSEELEKLRHKQYVAERKLTAAKYKEKRLQNELKRLIRSERTHRLCTRAGMLETFLKEQTVLTEEQSEVEKKPEPKHSVTEKMKFLQEQSSNQQEQKTPQQKKQNMEL